MKRVLILLFSVLIIFNSAVFAEETEKTETEVVTSEYVYHFPEIKPEFYGFMGYRLIDISGSEKAGEFEYLHSSISGGWLLTAFPFPHRLHLEADVLNKKDFSGDVRYACKDIVLFRGLTRKVFHNLDNITLIDIGSLASYTVDPKDTGEKYGVAKSMSSLFLRLKTPNFPFHVYLGGSFINKDGTQQQRFLGKAAKNAANRISVKRTIDWNSRDIVLGTNSHLAPVEIDLSHSEQRLDVDGDKVLSYDYSAEAVTVRPYGFPHNLMPELKGSNTTLKLHTSYTGKLVTAATFSWMNRENMDSNAKADYFIGAGDLIYMPYTKLTFFVKYRHKEKDTDNPDTIPANYLGYSAYTPAYISTIPGIRPSISSKVDRLSSTVRYRPIKRLTLNAEYTYERKERGNLDEWNIVPVTTQDILSLSVDTMIIEKLKLKAKYTHLKVREPAYNVQPDSSDEGKVSLSWNLLNGINAFLSYSIAKEKRDGIEFEDESVPSPFPAGDREGRRDRLLGSITFIACKNLTITPSYAYIRNKIKQDLLYNDDGNIPGEYYRDSDVRYGDIAHTYAINFNYEPMKNLNLDADISHTASKGNFYPGGLISTVTSLSGTEANAKIRETNYAVRGDYEFKKGWGLGMSYKYVDYNDLLNNSNNGNLHAVLMTISKRW